MRYDSGKKIPEGFTEKERREIEDTIKDFECQLTFHEEFGERALHRENCQRMIMVKKSD